jgi:hypothetical protein
MMFTAPRLSLSSHPPPDYYLFLSLYALTLRILHTLSFLQLQLLPIQLAMYLSLAQSLLLRP